MNLKFAVLRVVGVVLDVVVRGLCGPVRATGADLAPAGTEALNGRQADAQRRERRRRALAQIALTEDGNDTNEIVRTR